MFVNVIIRNNPTALGSYETCRKAACANSGKAARDAAVAKCSADSIGKFMPASLKDSVLPTRMQFDFDSDTLRPGMMEKLNLTATFLVANPATKVKLVGRADKTGPDEYNLKLGQRRADSVKAALVKLGVPLGQIVSSTSVEETQSIAKGPSEFFLDRSVEISP